jgi:formylglycine-generating enzyme required for sulfatase activity
MPDDRANPPPAAVEPGATIGPYRIASIVADGPSGTVYEAVESTTGRRIALRHLPIQLARESAALEKILAAAGKGLKHPNVAAVEGVERHGDDTYLVTEFVGGRPAGSGGGRVPWRIATRIIRDAARGLAAIHNAGLVHGHVKRAHLIVAHDGSVKLTDLGMAGLDETPVNPECAAPELVRGNPPDARTDLYALGATYSALLTGQPPFADAGNPIDVYDAILHRPTPNVRTGSPDMPLRCDTIVQKAMAKNPAARYQSAELLLTDLDAVLAADEPVRRRQPPMLPRRRSAWRRPAVLLAGLIIIIAAAVGAWHVFGPSDSATTTQPSTKSRPPGRPTVTNSIGMVLAPIPAGRFMMGDPTVGDARPQHAVVISRPFLIGVTEVTQAQYQIVVGGESPSHFSGDKRPVDRVTWDEAVTFCDKLSARAGEQSAGRVYRLPTEAEWEFACRAGTNTAFGLGPTLPGPAGNTQRSGFRATVDVGLHAANPAGLYDMHGNVAEWCQDWYGVETYITVKPIDPIGPSTGRLRVARGGSWETEPAECRSASRAGFEPTERNPAVGFRVVSTIDSGK